MMRYHMDDEKVSLDALRKRIESTDLVPSRIAILEGISGKFKLFQEQGIGSFAKLRYALKTPKRLEELAAATGIDHQYLLLLRREIESYFPKPSKLTEFNWLPEGEIRKLIEHGLRDSAALYEATRTVEDVAKLQKTSAMDSVVLVMLLHLTDLTRVQWVSPTAARMILACGHESPAQLAAADADALYEGFNRVNEEGKFFKGKIGLRDVKRLIHAARFVEA